MFSTQTISLITVDPSGIVGDFTFISDSCLFWKKTRNWAVIVGIATHIFILVYLSPLGINHNTVVYPWNIALMILVYLAFYNYEQKINLWPKQNRLTVGIAILFACLLPALNLIDKWDNYFSFNLYTDNIEDLFVVIPDQEVVNLPEPLKNYVYEVEVKEGVKSLNVSRWSFGELNVPVNPEPRIFRLISKGYCNTVSNSSNLTFLEITRKEPRELKKQYTCKTID